MPPDGSPSGIPTALLHDRRDAARKLENYEARVAPLRVRLRESAREQGIGFYEALQRLEQLQQLSEFDRMLYWAACLDCIEGGEIPEAHQETQSRKPARGRVPGWAKTLCAGGTRLVVPKEAAKVGELRELLLSGRYRESVLPEERQEGFCDIDYALDTDFKDPDRWLFAEIVVVGWRVDERQINSGLLKSETEKAIREWMNREGKSYCEADTRRAIRDDVKAALLKKCLPKRRIYPLVWVLTEGMLLVQGPKKVVAAVKQQWENAHHWSPFEILHPGVRVVLGLLGEQCTDLRQSEEIAATNSSGADGGDLGAGALNDLLLWLAVVGEDGGHLEVEGRTLEWAIDGPVILLVPKREEGIIRVELSGTEQLFAAALAEGAHLLEIRLMVAETFPPAEEGGERRREQFHLTLNREDDGLEVSALGLPRLPSVGGGEDATAAEVYARVETYKRLIALLQLLLRCFASVRIQDWGAVIKRGRRWIGLELKRYEFDPKTGQGWLFAPPEPAGWTGGKVGEA